jgi:peptide/nickel transport system permease protein
MVTAPFPNPASSSESTPSLGALVRRVTRSYLFRSLLQTVITIWAVMTFTFVLVRLLPGDPVQTMIDRLMQEGQITYEEARDRASLMLSSDLQQPAIIQYINYLGNVVRLNLGESYTSPGTPVLRIISGFLPWTLFCVGLALLISFTIGLLVGMLMAFFRNTIFDTILTTITSFLNSIPDYLIAILIVYAFGVQLKWFSVAAARDAYSVGVQPSFSLAFFLDVLAHAALPVLTYFLASFGGWALTMKNSTLGVLGEEYVNAANARGLGQARIITSYVGRNAALPLVTQLALSIGFVVGGSVIIERYFQYPGIGYRLVESVNQRDYPTIQGIFLMITLAVIVANLLTDFFYSRLDPRVRINRS